MPEPQHVPGSSICPLVPPFWGVFNKTMNAKCSVEAPRAQRGVSKLQTLMLLPRLIFLVWVGALLVYVPKHTLLLGVLKLIALNSDSSPT